VAYKTGETYLKQTKYKIKQQTVTRNFSVSVTQTLQFFPTPLSRKLTIKLSGTQSLKTTPNHWKGIFYKFVIGGINL
jgi:hypothetical protein